MSTELQQQQMEMGTKPIREHEWLNKLVGDWRTETEMWMAPGQPPMKSSGTEKVRNSGGLWAVAEGRTEMPNGTPVEYVAALGYDVSFKEYRGCWFGSMSSHLWKQAGELSDDGRTMTLSCVGPNMYRDGETANYRDVIEIIDENHRTMASYGEDENGQMQQHMRVTYTRV